MAFRLRTIPAVIALSASALLLSACVPTEPDPVGPNPTRTIDPENTETPTPSATATAVPDVEATPLEIACTDLISPEAMYAFNPNFLLLNDFTPDADSAAATALAAKGVACRWENSTSGVSIDVAVAKPSPAKRDALKSSAGSATDAFFGFDGYFAVSGQTGTAQLFSGDYWATLSSKAFFEAADAAELAVDIRDALK